MGHGVGMNLDGVCIRVGYVPLGYSRQSIGCSSVDKRIIFILGTLCKASCLVVNKEHGM